MIMPISLNAEGFYLMKCDEPYGCASDITAPRNPQSSSEPGKYPEESYPFVANP